MTASSPEREPNRSPGSSPPLGELRSVAIVGGGISGLSAALRVRELAPQVQVTLLESADRLGGVLQTRETDGFLWETSADNFITNVPAGLDLCRRVGLEQELLETLPAGRQAYVVRRGNLLPVPLGFSLMQATQLGSIAATRILSPLGKLRLAAEALIAPRRDAGDESLASFARRRLGRETFERLVQPLVGGIYSADPERLSMQATLPRFLEMERRYGSLTRAAWAERKTADRQVRGARYQLFVAPRQGMSRLVEAVAANLTQTEIRRNARVSRIMSTDGKWQISWQELGSQDPHTQSFDAMILATPAPTTSQLVKGFDAELAAQIGRIQQAGCVIVVAGYSRENCPGMPPAAGFVVPEIEGRRLLAASFSSQKFPGRAPEGCVLLRAFLGGAQHPEVESWSDLELQQIVADELGNLIGLRGKPKFLEIVRWQGAMPQYHVGHLDLVQLIETRAGTWPRLALAGNAYRGVGVPHCIASGEQAAARVLGMAQP